jgi:hypothetical protein
MEADYQKERQAMVNERERLEAKLMQAESERCELVRELTRLREERL